MAFPRPSVILFMGPPGAGKGTQANAFVDAVSGYRHFDTGRMIERAINDPKNQDDPAIGIEKERFAAGLLTSYEFKMRIITEGINAIASEGMGVVLSGSPRTRHEAEQLTPFLQDIYGQDSIALIQLIIKPETTIFRNSHRRICSRCGRALVWTEENQSMTFCPECGGELKTRVLDTEEVIKKRLQEYEHRTAEVVQYLVASGVPVRKIDGEARPEEVTRHVLAVFEELKKELA